MSENLTIACIGYEYLDGIHKPGSKYFRALLELLKEVLFRDPMRTSLAAHCMSPLLREASKACIDGKRVTVMSLAWKEKHEYLRATIRVCWEVRQNTPFLEAFRIRTIAFDDAVSAEFHRSLLNYGTVPERHFLRIARQREILGKRHIKKAASALCIARWVWYGGDNGIYHGISCKNIACYRYAKGGDMLLREVQNQFHSSIASAYWFIERRMGKANE